MNKILKYSLFIVSVLLLQSCVKDMQDDLNDGGWSHDRMILDIKLKNQVGKAEIERIDDVSGEIELSLNIDAINDLSKVELEKLQLSYDAKSSVSIGSILDFSNSDRTANITITSATGQVREYKVYAKEFRETVTGTWSINDLTVYGGTGAEYGGAAVLQLQSKSWCWYDDYAPKVEFDNILTFTMDQITEEGNTSGICINNAGADGKYADFIFKGTMNADNPGVDLDLKHFYRQIPEGESRWIRNYSLGTISFTDKNGKVTSGVLENPGTYDLGNGKSITIANNAFSFALSGKDDWDHIYSDFDKFAKKARKYYIMVTKQ
ncbi:hypothetical protein [Dysgonomonas sp. BGC7]|uniref:hypothetical protein n=1 Tax=Dysgonomonas sp. BGC7 TaxID=1658008 RepID=UPI000682669C|nr:hypothetical protein [Dysgonomonas sp. BGC7]MBD8388553.1 hypothetical protein [Dysgonomonas sp. BGC7]